MWTATRSGLDSIRYDANGNITNKNGATVTWYADNKLQSISAPGVNTSFEYTPSGAYWRQVATYLTNPGWIASSAGNAAATAASSLGLNASTAGWAASHNAMTAFSTNFIAGAAAGAVGGGITGGWKGALVGGISGFAYSSGNALWRGVGNVFVRGAAQAITSGLVVNRLANLTRDRLPIVTTL